jgi:predicted transcriptional regulator
VVTRGNALSIYIPKKKEEHHPMKRLGAIAKKKDRSVNYLIVEAILQYLDREESK